MNKNVTGSVPKKTYKIPYILQGEFFQIIKQEGEAVTVLCKKCPQKSIYKGSVKSTGNFHMHVKRKHSDFLERLQELKLKSFMERKVKLPNTFKSNRYIQLLHKNNILQTGDLQTTAPNLFVQRPDILDNLPINCCKKNNESKIKSNCFAVGQNDSEMCASTLSKKFNANGLSEPGAHLRHLDNCQISNTNTMPDCLYQQCNNGIPMAATLTAASMMLSPTQEALDRIDNHLKTIERQLNLRNQIETNRIYFDLAKFKYLHPNFAFQA